MKYCVKCDSEYLNEIQVCADCGEPLVWEEEYRRKKEQKESKREHLDKLKFVPVKYVENAFEADRIKDALEQEGIHVLVKSSGERAFSRIFTPHRGWGCVEVPESEKSRAEQIINELSRAFPEEVEKEEE